MEAGDWIILLPLLLGAFGSMALWVLSRLDKAASCQANEIQELREWTRDLFAEKQHVARLEERIIRLDEGVTRLSLRLDRVLLLLEEVHLRKEHTE